MARLRQANTLHLHTLHFADDCTALVKLSNHHHGTSSSFMTRYLSLLRVQNEWRIIREVQTTKTSPSSSSSLSWLSLGRTIQDYMEVEHGGGTHDVKRATKLFHPRATLTAVGMTDDEDDADLASSSAWSAPAGTYLEIPLDTYIAGVADQTPHDTMAATHDAVINVDVTGNAAAAVVRVGNGAQTLVFEDILLLGQSADGKYQILSKTFSPQAWPIKS